MVQPDPTSQLLIPVPSRPLLASWGAFELALEGSGWKGFIWSCVYRSSLQQAYLTVLIISFLGFFIISILFLFTHLLSYSSASLWNMSSMKQG